MNVKDQSKLPIFVVDDHNEVLPYIHRSIGSKHLPFSGLTMIHFDAHPDLLVPNNMKAADIFDKQFVYDSVSIATWMVPLLYAGHVSTVVWVKPPWAEQIADGTYMFWVGECRNSGCIRLSCKINYFISEALYVPEEDLINKKRVTLITITLEPSSWSSSPAPPASDTTTLYCSSEPTVTGTAADSPHVAAVGQPFPEDCHISAPNLLKDSKTELTQKSSDNSTRSSNSTLTSEDQDCHHHQHHHNDNNNHHQTIANMGMMPAKIEPGPSPLKKPCLSSVKLVEDMTKSCPPDQVHDEALGLRLKSVFSSIANLGEGLILDIDLDFYSTKNPFLEMFTDKQYQMLKELYHFTEPASDSEQAVTECIQSRRKQLEELEEVFRKLDNDPGAQIDKSLPRSDLLTCLVDSLHKNPSTPIDFLILHDAGCTCDDTELPHHVSSLAQIEQLIKYTDIFMSHLPKPKLVTIARSVSDEYCPPEQVENIQDAVVSLLDSRYAQMQLVKSYE
ncbi:Hypothetical predicted protein [Octopus vulgaris]|uniref:Uncharacterized protein n=1 Tax=Octopus vulgaris TaxID=6645 RepID=A0AA36C204_OCTVU|nr:Hypothetical predicted protein [Octopus vulgaris]